jgi:hypothetical protein
VIYFCCIKLFKSKKAEFRSSSKSMKTMFYTLFG